MSRLDIMQIPQKVTLLYLGISVWVKQQAPRALPSILYASLVRVTFEQTAL